MNAYESAAYAAIKRIAIAEGYADDEATDRMARAAAAAAVESARTSAAAIAARMMGGRS